jgi:hypothetical protein
LQQNLGGSMSPCLLASDIPVLCPNKQVRIFGLLRICELYGALLLDLVSKKIIQKNLKSKLN